MDLSPQGDECGRTIGGRSLVRVNFYSPIRDELSGSAGAADAAAAGAGIGAKVETCVPKKSKIH